MSTPEAAAGDRLLTVPEVAAALRVDENTVRRWIKRGRLHGFNLGNRTGYRVSQSELDHFLAAVSTQNRTAADRSSSG